MREIREIKEEAKELCRQHRGKLVGIWFLNLLVAGIMSGFVNSITTEGSGLRALGELIVCLISIAFAYGVTISFLKVKREEQVGMLDFLKEGFSVYGKILYKTLYIGACACLILLGCAFLVGAVTGIFLETETAIYIAYLVGIIVAVILLAKYSMTDFIIYDRPELKGKEALEMSKQIMPKEIVKKYLLMLLSFFGWYLLVGFIVGIGYNLLLIGMIGIAFGQISAMLIFGGILVFVALLISLIFIAPYVQMATVCFYEDLKEQVIAPQEEETVSETIPQE